MRARTDAELAVFDALVIVGQLIFLTKVFCADARYFPACMP